MNLGQILLVLASVMILGMVSLNVNSMLLNKEVTMMEAKVSLTALDLAGTLMTEIVHKNFDAVTAAGLKVDSASQFTAAASLGPSDPEKLAVTRPEPPDTLVPYKSFKNYDDVDDYDGYVRNAATEVGNFRLSTSVYYVTEGDLDASSSQSTFFKRVVITVTNPNMKAAHSVSEVVLYRK